jgi:hypothetical protein
VRRLAAAALALAAACAPARPAGPAPDPPAFRAALAAARALTPADVLPLRVARPDARGAVRVVVFTPYPGYADTLARGATGELELPELWVTLEGEVRDSCAHFPRGAVEVETARLLGLTPRDGPGRRFVVLEVPAASLFRPSADPDPSRALPCLSSGCPLVPDSAAMRGFLDRQRADGYPFTGLGYTYNWRDGAPRYGASEYVVRSGSRARVVSVTPPAAYCTG